MRNALLSFVVILTLLLASWTVNSFMDHLADNLNNQAATAFVGKTIHIEQPEPPYQFDFQVTGVETSILYPPGKGTVLLSGSLPLDQPEGAQYLGLAQGSTIVNWQKPQGKGFSWVIKNTDVHVVNSPMNIVVDIHVTNATVR